MNQESFKRKLSAILSADAVGYSRLMGDDDEATVRTLTLYRTAISDLVQQFRGRIVDNPGDNILAEFTSVVDAVNCSVEIQRELAERNAELPENRRMLFRIGVNLGDVIEESGRIYGDGVNIAARVESLAEPGDICLSGRVYDQVANRLGLEYENLGKHQVKNISVPIRVYRVLSYPGAAAHRVVKARKTIRQSRRKILITAAAIVLVVAAGLIWQFQFRKPPIAPASEEDMKFSLPAKPSIAVLPFENMSNDPEQEYFCDGLAEEILTTLSKIPQLFVISRNSSFVYKGKPVKIKQVAEDLGVRYVLEGSFRKAGEKVRITAQLIDATRGHHVWAERYEGELRDIFAFQDQITYKIVSSLGVELIGGEEARRLSNKFANNPEIFLMFSQGMSLYYKQTPESNHKVKKMLNEIIQEIPESECSYFYSLLAANYFDEGFNGWSKSPKESMEKAYELSKKALDLDQSNQGAYGVLSWIYLMKGDYDKAIKLGEKSVELCPNCAGQIAVFGMLQTYACRFQEAIFLLEKAIRLNPLPPHVHVAFLGINYSYAGRHEDAIQTLKKALKIYPRSLAGNIGLISAYVFSGQTAAAKESAQKLLRLYPKISLQYLKHTDHFKEQSVKERRINAFRKAGIPEKSAYMSQEG